MLPSAEPRAPRSLLSLPAHSVIIDAEVVMCDSDGKHGPPAICAPGLARLAVAPIHSCKLVGALWENQSGRPYCPSDAQRV